MKKLHYVHLKYVMGELEHDAIMKQAAKYGCKSIKTYLELIVSFEIDRLREEHVASLSIEEVQAYDDRQSHRGDEIDDEIPF